MSAKEKNDQEHMDAFLRMLQRKGIDPEVVIRDGSPLYKDSLQEIWQGINHQLCVFHVIKEVNKLILDALRSIKSRIKNQGRKGRKKRRGRVSESIKKLREKTKGESNKEKASFLWENQYLIVRKSSSMEEEDTTKLAQMIAIDEEIGVLRKFNEDIYQLFEKGITPQQARCRRTLLAHNPLYQKNAFLVKAIKKIPREKFEKMIVFLKYGEQGQRTSNHVERNNRSFRMMQKTRYKRRQRATIIIAIELFLDRQMKKHPLYALSA